MNKEENFEGLTGIEFNPSEVIRILTPKQIAAYWLNGVTPLDIYPSRDFKTGEPVLVGLFKRSETKDVFDKWVNKELK